MEAWLSAGSEKDSPRKRHGSQDQRVSGDWPASSARGQPVLRQPSPDTRPCTRPLLLPSCTELYHTCRPFKNPFPHQNLSRKLPSSGINTKIFTWPLIPLLLGDPTPATPRLPTTDPVHTLFLLPGRRVLPPFSCSFSPLISQITKYPGKVLRALPGSPRNHSFPALTALCDVLTTACLSKDTTSLVWSSK